jgi:hypothetical protein
MAFTSMLASLSKKGADGGVWLRLYKIHKSLRMHHLFYASSLIAVASAALTFPPVQPSSYPVIAPGKGIFLSGAALSEEVVLDGLAQINAVVPPLTISILRGNLDDPVNFIAVDYVASSQPEDANCYWPYNLCVRESADATVGYGADLSTCPGNDWGLSFGML